MIARPLATTLLALAPLGLLLGLLQGPVHATQIAYEGFSVPGDYAAASDIASGAATAGQGDWTTGWARNETGTLDAQASSLSGGALSRTASPGSAANTGRVNYTRQFTNPTGLAAGDAVWFSARFRRDLGVNDFQLKFASDTGENNGWGFHVPANFNADPTFKLGASTKNDQVPDGGVAFENGTTYFVVGRMTIDTNDINFEVEDTVDIWLNPAEDLSGAAVGSGDSTDTDFTASNDDYDFDRINIWAHQNLDVTFDEIRLGTEFSDVAVIPEPSTAALIVVGAALMCARRRRRAR